MSVENPTAEDVITYSSGTTHEAPPDLRFVHYNDVYHVEPSSAEPVGGIARFQSLVNHYRNDPKFEGQPDLVTFFSGDAFNPSLESSVTKGAHMVPILNGIGTDVACVGVRIAVLQLGDVLTRRRTTTSTLASASIATSPASASSRGCSPMCSTRT